MADENQECMVASWFPEDPGCMPATPSNSPSRLPQSLSPLEMCKLPQHMPAPPLSTPQGACTLPQKTPGVVPAPPIKDVPSGMHHAPEEPIEAPLCYMPLAPCCDTGIVIMWLDNKYSCVFHNYIYK